MRTRMLLAACAAAVLLASVGCGKPAEKSSWVEIRPGLSYVDSVVGDGPAVQADDFIEVHYTGWLWEDGHKGVEFDSSHKRGETIAFAIGRHAVIEGWEQGVPGMQVGGVRSLLIGPDLAYGERGSPPNIPGGATLIFDIELVSLPEVQVEILEQGDGPVAEVGDQVSVDYTGWVWEDGAKGKQFDSSHDRGIPYRFTLGQRMVIPGWDMALTGMKAGTKAQLVIPPIMGYGKRGRPPVIPPEATLCFDVELVEIQGKTGQGQ